MSLQKAYLEGVNAFYQDRYKNDTWDKPKDDEEYKLTYCKEKNGELSDQLLEQWKAGSFCDAKFSVNGETVQAHRCVLAACCKYFDTMFCGDFKEKSLKEVDLSESFKSADSLRAILGSIYGSTLDISEDNVQDVLHGADLFGLPDLIDHCVLFLLNNLQLQNCLWTWTLADTYSLQEIATFCQDIAICRFNDTLIDLDETFTLPSAYLIKFLQKGITKFCCKGKLEQFITKYSGQDEICCSKRELLAAIEDGTKCELPCYVTVEKPKDEKDDEKKKDTSEKKDEFDESDIYMNIGLPTAKGVQPYQENKKNTTLYENAGARPKVKNHSFQQGQAKEEIVVGNFNGLGKWCIYSPSKNQWLTNPGTFENIGNEWNIKLLGVGPNQEYALFESIFSKSYKLINLTDMSTTDMDVVPNVGPSASAHTSRKLMDCILTSDNQLFSVLLNKRMEQRKPKDKDRKKPNESWMDNLHGIYNMKEIMYGVYIQRYDFHKKKWIYVSRVMQCTEEITRIQCLQQSNGETYIFSFQTENIFLVCYNPKYQNFVRLKTYKGYVPFFSYGETTTALFGFHDQLVLGFDNKTVVYNITNKSWTRDDKATLPLLPDLEEIGFKNSKEQQPIAFSQSNGKIYLLVDNVVPKTYFLWYSPLEKVYKHLASVTFNPPVRVKAFTQVICQSILEKLQPVSMQEKIKEPLLLPAETWGIILKYRKRTGREIEASKDEKKCQCPHCVVHRENNSDDENYDPEDYMYDSDEYKYMFGHGMYSYDDDDDDDIDDDGDGVFNDDYNDMQAVELIQMISHRNMMNLD